MRKSREERFLNMVSPEPNTGCWLWTGTRTKRGYPTFDDTTAHRIAYQMYVGSIPEGLQVDHLCTVILCVNPKHLRVATPYENLFAEHSWSSARKQKAKTHCIHGHAFDEQNTYRYKTGWRHCRKCDAIAALKRYYRIRKVLNVPTAD